MVPSKKFLSPNFNPRRHFLETFGKFPDKKLLYLGSFSSLVQGSHVHGCMVRGCMHMSIVFIFDGYSSSALRNIDSMAGQMPVTSESSVHGGSI